MTLTSCSSSALHHGRRVKWHHHVRCLERLHDHPDQPGQRARLGQLEHRRFRFHRRHLRGRNQSTLRCLRRQAVHLRDHAVRRVRQRQRPGDRTGSTVTTPCPAPRDGTGSGTSASRKGAKKRDRGHRRDGRANLADRSMVARWTSRRGPSPSLRTCSSVTKQWAEAGVEGGTGGVGSTGGSGGDGGFGAKGGNGGNGGTAGNGGAGGAGGNALGGAIYNAGSLTLTSTTFDGDDAAYGGSGGYTGAPGYGGFGGSGGEGGGGDDRADRGSRRERRAWRLLVPRAGRRAPEAWPKVAMSTARGR